MKTLVVLTGPTAVGKTSISIDIARKLKTEIISCDSRQFYKELKIGVASPSDKDLKKIKHHFIGNLSIKKKYSAGQFETDALKLIENLLIKKKYALLVGGSGLFIDAVCNGFNTFPNINYKIRDELNKIFQKKGIETIQQKLEKLDPTYFKRVDINNPQRIIRALEVCLVANKPYSYFLNKKKEIRNFNIKKICLNIPRNLLYEKINKRVDNMMEIGLLEEAKKLYPFKNLNALQTVGYKELFAHFDGDITLNEAIKEIKKNTRRYAKRQLTWFKKDQSITWVNSTGPIINSKKVLELLNN